MNKYIFFICVFVIVLGTAFLYINFLKPQPPTSEMPTAGVKAENQSPIIPIGNTLSGWKVFQNNDYGFAFQYPESGTIQSNPSTPDIVSNTLVYFKDHSNDTFLHYNQAVVSFEVYKKGVFKLHLTNEKCGFRNRTNTSIDSRPAIIVEESNCEGSEAGGANHLYMAVLPLSDTLDLVYIAYLDNDYIRNEKVGEKILTTLKFKE